MRFALWSSVKGRLFVILLLSSVVPLSLLGIITYSSFHSFLENKLKSGVQESLEKERIGLDNIVKNLNFASQQLALDKALTQKINRFLETDDPLVKGDILPTVLERIALINYTSPHAGIIALLDADSRPFIHSYPIVDQIGWDRFPLLLEANGVIYHAPHLSADKYNDKNELVFSLVREVVNYETNTSFYVYLESNFQSVRRLFGSEQYGEPVLHLLLDSQNRIVYSEDNRSFPAGSVYHLTANGEKVRDTLRFATDSGQGWKLVVVMQGDAFQREIDAWFRKFVTIGLISLLLSILLALFAWRTVYRPLHVFRKEIEWMETNQVKRQKRWLRLREFDEVLGRFYQMKDHLFDLLTEIERREQAKSRMEVEKLRFQINPHFIHNTLNTVQVIAKMHKQEEIVRLITYFTRILHYNLGKDGSHVRVSDEIDNLNDYLGLQQIRYSHQFEVSTSVEPEIADFPIPRFMLQPLVENAIYHGFRNRDGSIQVVVEPHPEGGIRVQVQDNGEGMDRGRLVSLLEDKAPEIGQTGMGIGLSFVHRLIQTYYGERYGLHIQSELGVGTTITIHIPYRWKGGSPHDSDIAG